MVERCGLRLLSWLPGWAKLAELVEAAVVGLAFDNPAPKSLRGTLPCRTEWCDYGK